MAEKSQNNQRRLAAIVAADIVDYSRLISTGEEETIARLHKLRTEVFESKLRDYNGRIANTAGDSYLIEFLSAVDALRFAVDVQEQVNNLSLGAPEELILRYRMGINVGDVVASGNDLLGDGVNVAARVEALADAGGICITRAVRDQVRDRVQMQFTDLGEVEVKNIKRPVRVFSVATEADQTESGTVAEVTGSKLRPQMIFPIAAIVLLLIVLTGGYAWWLQLPDFEPVDSDSMTLQLPDEPSIAVMPFELLSEGNEDYAYLADGLSENITVNLARVPDLVVIGRQSSSVYKGQPIDIKEVSKRFGVRYLLTGSVQKAGNDLRVTAQLIDAVEGSHVWSDTFDRSSESWFLIQDEITLAILDKIYKKTIRGDYSTEGGTTKLAAYSEFLQGWSEQMKFTAEGNRDARKHYEKAVSVDPGYARAYSRIGFSHLMDARMGFVSDASASIALAEEFLQKSLRDAEDLPSSLGLMAMIRVIQKQPEEARRLVRQAMDLAPGDADIAGTASWVLKYIGDSDDAIIQFTRARRLQPVHQWWLVADEFGAFIDAGQFDRAVEHIDEYMNVAPPSFRPAFLCYAAAAAWGAGDEDLARSLIAEALAEDSDLSITDLHPFDIAYVDQSIPGRRYAILRQLGLPD